MEKEKEKNEETQTKIKKKLTTQVSDREILTIIKEEKNFPKSFSSRIKLSLLIKYYNKYWNNEFTDESDATDSD